MSKITDLSKTIVALATALGSGSIAVIRLSGSQAINYVNNIFPARDLVSAERNTIHFGKLIFQDREIDQVLVSIFKTPHSYTGEDLVEISCHANPYIVKSITDAMISFGATHAGPGEFTLRAFLNGKIDLSQAEAVSDIISAKTEKGLSNSVMQLEGALSGYLENIKQSLISVLGILEIDLDFAEEGIEIAPESEISQQLSRVEEKIKRLINSFNYGKLFSSTLNLAIIGAPNVGKSSLLNVFVGEERAITSHTPGTTRDTLQENIIIDNIYFKVIDTAGLRHTEDDIEKKGIERTKQQIASANIILYVIDGSDHNTSLAFLDDEPTNQKFRSRTLLVVNKCDLGINPQLKERIKACEMPDIFISAKTGEGIEDLKNEIVDQVSRGINSFNDEIVVTNARHRDILNRIFATFCIGK